MKIQLIKVKFDGNEVYKYLPFDYCCENLRLNPMISLSTDLENQSLYCTNCEHNDEYNSDACQHCETYKPDNDDNLPCFKLERTVIEEDYYNSYESQYYLNIDFCPHCGEKIDIEIVDSIDCSNAYITLKKERIALWNKCVNTDSKSEERKIQEQVRELDEKINDFYEIGPVDEYLKMQN